MKNWLKDLIFILYFAIAMPLLSLFFFGYTFTNFEGIYVLISIVIFWLAVIPYPLYWYLKNRIFIS